MSHFLTMKSLRENILFILLNMPQQFPLIFGPFSVLYSMYFCLFLLLLRKIKIYSMTCTTFLNFPNFQNCILLKKKLNKNPIFLDYSANISSHCSHTGPHPYTLARNTNLTPVLLKLDWKKIKCVQISSGYLRQKISDIVTLFSCS